MNQRIPLLAVITVAASLTFLSCKSSTAPTDTTASLSGSIYYNIGYELYRFDFASSSLTHVGTLNEANVLPNKWILGLVNNVAIGEMTADGAQSTTILEQSQTQPYNVSLNNPQISPDGQLVAYDDGSNHAYVVDLTGNLQVTIGDATHRYVRPVWGRDGSIYVEGSFGNYGLYKVDPQFQTITRIDHNLDQPTEPCVSQDGTKLAFIVGGHIWTMNTDGSNLQQITTGSGTESWPVWSPDGKWIAAYSPPSADFIAVQPGTTNLIHFSQQYAPFSGSANSPTISWQFDWK